MSLLNVLYNSYQWCLDNNLVDDCEKIDEKTVLLPPFHTNKRSQNGKDIVKVLLKDTGEFIKAEFLNKDEMIIFPVTEDSLTRSSNVAAHPLCDELQYIYPHFQRKKFKDYSANLNGWVEYNIKNNTFVEIKAIYEYIKSARILEDIKQSIFYNKKGVFDKNLKFTYFEVKKDKETKDKEIKEVIDFKKVHITFVIATIDSDLCVTKTKAIHDNYIAYQRTLLKSMEKKYCSVSGEFTYCTYKHRGFFGTSKLISASNNKETYIGRFANGSEIISVGYEASCKIHNMLKYLIENKNTEKCIGENTYLINWFSEDISNEINLNVLSGTSITNEDEDEDEGNDSKDINIPMDIARKFILGYGNILNDNSHYYVLIIENSSIGRLSVKYFREISVSDLKWRLKNWYDSTQWTVYRTKERSYIKYNFSIYTIIDYILGNEGANGMVCVDKKLRKGTIERLLPCVIEGKKIPRDLVKKVFNNLKKRQSYDKEWRNLLDISCALIKKEKFDYYKKEIGYMLEVDNKDINYLYGRLLAIAEKVERDTYNKEVRQTNAERLWEVYTRRPAKTWQLLESKLKPYYKKLLYDKPYMHDYYKILVTNITDTISTQTNKLSGLNEDFILGYYHQRKDLYTKKIKGEKLDESVNEQD